LTVKKQPTQAKEAPTLLDALSERSKQRFPAAQLLLKQLATPFQPNSRLLRGLDYSLNTAFKITSDWLGAQATVWWSLCRVGATAWWNANSWSGLSHSG
jgi:histidyl-tRNA synthetase